MQQRKYDVLVWVWPPPMPMLDGYATYILAGLVCILLIAWDVLDADPHRKRETFLWDVFRLLVLFAPLVLGAFMVAHMVEAVWFEFAPRMFYFLVHMLLFFFLLIIAIIIIGPMVKRPLHPVWGTLLFTAVLVVTGWLTEMIAYAGVWSASADVRSAIVGHVWKWSAHQ